jgi:hypothetical protein
MLEPFRYRSPTMAGVFILRRRHHIRGHKPTIRDPNPHLDWMPAFTNRMAFHLILVITLCSFENETILQQERSNSVVPSRQMSPVCFLCVGVCHGTQAVS